MKNSMRYNINNGIYTPNPKKIDKIKRMLESDDKFTMKDYNYIKR